MHGKENVLITGGLGNLGSWISRYLANKGYTVYILSRHATYQIDGIRYVLIEADITSLESLENALDFEVNYCIHAASFNEFFLDGYPKKALDVNVLGTRNLLEVLSKKNLKHFIYFSTFHVYGVSSGNITEKSSLKPKNDYASTHLFAEYYIQQFSFTHDINYSILRLTNSYGCPVNINSDKWYLVLNDLVKSAYENKEILLNSNGEASRDFIHMNDVASIVEKLLQINPMNEIFNLSSMKSIKIIEIARMVQKVYKKRYNLDINIFINDKDKYHYDSLIVDNSKLQNKIPYDISDKFIDEINAIFTLLEERK